MSEHEQPKRFTGRGANLKTGITERHRQVAREILIEGKPITRAMADNGFSAKSAKQGMARIRRSKPLALAYAQEIERLKNRPVCRTSSVLPYQRQSEFPTDVTSSSSPFLA
jgi:hypothetical protein